MEQGIEQAKATQQLETIQEEVTIDTTNQDVFEIHHTAEYNRGTKEQAFNQDFLEGCYHALNYPTPFMALPYWISLAGNLSVDDTVARWEVANSYLPGGPVTITLELRRVWALLAQMINEVHAMTLRCWLRWKLTEDTDKRRLTFPSGDDWEDYSKAIYFTRMENCPREPAVLDICNKGSFGFYFKTVSDCYDLMRGASLYGDEM